MSQLTPLMRDHYSFIYFATIWQKIQDIASNIFSINHAVDFVPAMPSRAAYDSDSPKCNGLKLITSRT